VLYSGRVSFDSAPDDDERRGAERIAMLGGLPGEIMVFAPMLIKEVSIAGVTVETRFPLQINSLHDVRLALDGTPVIIKGRVVHSFISEVDQDIVTYRTGLEFAEPSERGLVAISRFLESIKTTRSRR
jgi:hypothetical protein